MDLTDKILRNAAFTWLERQVELKGDILPFTLLRDGFVHAGHKITFMNMPGIWRPQGFNVPLSIRTGTDSPYSDKNYSDGTLLYSYRGSDPNHRDNVGLRMAMERQIPLIYFKAIRKGQYLVQFPVYVEADDPGNMTCMVNLAPAILKHIPEFGAASTGYEIPEKKYALATYERRVHQAQFRDQVIHAYKCQCTMCRLKHVNLLDAAHIIPDKEERGNPIVPNGLALCKIHHAAFDSNIIGITPDYEVEVREDVLEEVDGPMLKYGLQSMHGQKIQLPYKKELRPDRDRIAERYDLFKSA